MENDDAAQDILTHIRKTIDSMSKGQQKVAEFLLTHGIDIVYLSANRIAGLVGVNPSTVVRTAQALGYEGFPELQTALQNELLKQNRIPLPAVDAATSADTEEVVLRRVVHTEAANVESLLQLVPEADFSRAVDIMTRTRRLYIMGLGISAPLSLHLYLFMALIRPACYLLKPGVNGLAIQLDELTHEDALFTVSRRRYSRDTLYCMNYARRVQASVITLTDTIVSPAARRADLAFVIPFHMWYDNSAAPYTLITAFFRAVSLRNGASMQERLNHLDQIEREFNAFEEEGENPLS